MNKKMLFVLLIFFALNVYGRHFSILLEELEASGIHFVAGIPITQNNREVHIFEK